MPYLHTGSMLKTITAQSVATILRKQVLKITKWPYNSSRLQEAGRVKISSTEQWNQCNKNSKAPKHSSLGGYLKEDFL